MSRKHRAPFVALVHLLARHHPNIPDAAHAVAQGRVLVDGRLIVNPRARVRSSARLELLTPRPLRGHTKLTTALDGLGLDVADATCLDVGAAAGGFTAALLDRGASRVYAVDAGFGQLAGWLRVDPRVVNLERTNLSEIGPSTVGESIDIVTMDLSYLSVARAVGQLESVRYATGALLLALVKPTFELHARSVVTDAASVRDALRIAIDAVEASPWTVAACTLPAVTGAAGAIEAFVLAARTWT